MEADCVVRLIRGCRRIKKYQRNRVGYCGSTMGIMSSCSSSVPVMSYSSSRFTSFPFLLHQTLLLVSVSSLPRPHLLSSNGMIGYIRGIPLSYPYLIAFVTFPICAFKNWINVIQMINAAKALAEVDKDDRRRMGLAVNSRPKRVNAGKRNR
jgi:hypothetical protein